MYFFSDFHVLQANSDDSLLDDLSSSAPTADSIDSWGKDRLPPSLLDEYPVSGTTPLSLFTKKLSIQYTIYIVMF
jgi:hypothetical protein